MTRRPNRGIDVEPVGSGTICISGGPRTTSTRHHPYGRCSNAGLRWRVAPATRWTPLTYASQDPHGRTPVPSRRVEPLSITERIQESNCCVPRSICRCCNAMMVRIEPLMQQPRCVRSASFTSVWNPAGSLRRCKLRRPWLITCVRSDDYLSHPLSSLVSDTLNESVDLVIVVAAGKFQELTDKGIAPFCLLGKKQ